ncbi:hypothetical protein CLV48_1215 [Cecembia rubra]|uniref:Uncharacterized protein n=1 Tax=Cecembia rubra TaxID=1485585 RepID=A0A2P8DK72_9BACT|nr:hypothetical protein CLV48_1215 [Cecembia rubra]
MDLIWGVVGVLIFFTTYMLYLKSRRNMEFLKLRYPSRHPPDFEGEHGFFSLPFYLHRH